jgi:DNA-binding transcriptional MerR regulator
MLRSNLSTRPFYNERAVRTMLAVLAFIAIGLTIFNAVEILRLERAGRDARQTVAQNAAQSRDLRQKAQVIRQGINQAQLEAVRVTARDANALIDRRTFSWTALLNYFQATLPPDVRIAGVAPQIDDDGRMLVAISVFARRIDDLSEFEDALESTGAFTDVLSRTIGTEQDGTTRAELQGYYSGPVAPAANNPTAASAPAGASEAAKVEGAAAR